VSAGAVNVAKLASHPGTFLQAMSELTGLWSELTVEHVFRVEPWRLLNNAVRLGIRLMSGGVFPAPQVRAFLDTSPLHEFLSETLATVRGEITGIDYNLARGAVRAVGIITTSYSTGQTVVFLRGHDIQPWVRPQRRTVMTPLTIDHVMASTALPMFFPAVRIGEGWYGDGGIRLAAPLSPALHMGADRILAISTRFNRTQVEADRPTVTGYPPPAQVLGVLLNAVFLDLIDQDTVRLDRINRMVESLPDEKRDGMRIVRLLTFRPSSDLSRMASKFEPSLPRGFRFMTRGLGTRETRSPDVLSMLMFQPDYIAELIAAGEADAEARAEEIEAFLEG
jgi:NTE family protein